MLFIDEKPSVKVCVGFALSAFLSSQMHNFSLAQAGLIYLAGLLFLKKDNKLQIKAYLLSGVVALFLFLPTSPIFYHQLFVNGGIGGWLSMPKASFIIDFFRYSLNYSYLFIFGFIIIVIYPFIRGKVNNDKKILLRIVGLALFMIPFVIAFVYSKLKEPILQFSTLIFGYPFFIITLFSFYDDKKIKMLEKTIVIGFILLVGITSLIIDRQYYKQVYNQGFDSMAAEMKKDMDCYSDSISFVSFSNRTLMTKFYQDKEDVINNKLYDKSMDIYDYQEYLSKLNTKYIGIGLSDHADISYEMITMMFYPNVLKECQWFNTKYLLLSKENIDNDMILMNNGGKIQEGYEWGYSFDMSLDTIENLDDIGFIAEIQSTDTINDIVLIVEIKDSNDRLLLWSGTDCKGHVLLPEKTYYLANGFHYDDEKYDKNEVKIKVYIWNKGKKFVSIEKLFFYNSEKNPYFLGLYEPLN